MKIALNCYGCLSGFNTNYGLRPNFPHKKGLMSEAVDGGGEGVSFSGGSLIEQTHSSVGWSVATDRIGKKIDRIRQKRL